jgi:two-component system sensor histidine kinase ChvG
VPDGAAVARASAGAVPASARSLAPRRRLASPFLRRILLVNALPLVMLVIGLLYLDQYQNGLMDADVGALREQARIYAGALGESAVQENSPRRGCSARTAIFWPIARCARGRAARS